MTREQLSINGTHRNLFRPAFSLLVEISSEKFTDLSPNMRKSSSCSCANLLLAFSNLFLLLLTASSFVPPILIRSPPAPLGVAFLFVSSLSLLSCIIGLYSRVTHFSFPTHVWIILAVLVGQVLGVLVLFTWEGTSLSLLRSPRDPREAKLLVRLECGLLMVMALLQTAVLVLTCAVHSCWVREHECLEAQRDATALRRSVKMSARVHHEVVGSADQDHGMEPKDLGSFN